MRWALVTVGLLLSHTPGVLAEPSSYALEFDAPEGCGSRESLLERLVARVPTLQLAEAELATVSFRVHFRQAESLVSVEIHASGPDLTPSVRTLPTRSCQEALDAAVWLLAVLIDPTQAQAPPSAFDGAAVPEAAHGPGSTPGTPPAEAAPSESAPPPVAEASQPSQPARPAAPKRPRPPPPVPLAVPGPPPDPAPLMEPEPGAGALAGVLESALPGPPLGFGFFLELLLERDSLWAPSFRLAYVDAGTGLSRAEAGDVEVGIVEGRLLACPARWRPVRLLGLRPCGLAELGRLSGNGVDTTNPTPAEATWFALGVTVRGEVFVSPGLALEFEPGLIAPFNRDRFVFQPSPEVGYEVPPLALTLSLAVTWYPWR